MSKLLPYEQSKDWGAIECTQVARDLASLRMHQTRRNAIATAHLNNAVEQLTVALQLLRRDETTEEHDARMERELAVLEQDHPTFSEMFAWGERYCILAHTMEDAPPDIKTRGFVIGHTTGMVDFGGPSGPGPVEECDMVVLKCDDGRTYQVYPGDLDPEEYAEQNIAMWNTP